jgi:hypothetical protein
MINTWKIALTGLMLAGWEAIAVPVLEAQAVENLQPISSVSWITTQTIHAAEAVQAAAADGEFVYAISSTQIAKYQRATGQRVAVSLGDARHLNSGFFRQGKLYCAHSNYPQKPDLSELKVLDVHTMQLTTFRDFGNYGGSLTWAVFEAGHWWCNFAHYGKDNARTFLVKFSEDWREVARWTYPTAVISQLRAHSISGGVWHEGYLLVTGHDDPVLFRLRVPEHGEVLELIDQQPVPFTGQGIAADSKPGGLIGIHRAKKQIVAAEERSNMAATTQQIQVIDPMFHHLRVGDTREWDDFPDAAENDHLEVAFNTESNSDEWTLQLRQQDVKQRWRVQLNEQMLGHLHQDENDMVVCFAVPRGTLVAGSNTLAINQESPGKSHVDDIRVGEIRLSRQRLKSVLSESAVEITVVDSDSNQPLPARITILNEAGSLQMVEVVPELHLAVRPGTIFSATGHAKCGLPAGRYTVHAGRGFEYSLASAAIEVAAGESVTQLLSIRREVSTDGYVACDPHVHTLTHSGHGDATVQERMVTLAAEGIELPVATDHNVQIDHDPFAREVGVRRFFTPVIGNEVTTAVGHFNVFPIPADRKVPNHRLSDWGAIFREINDVTGAPIVVLNHARDLHNGRRPFGPKHFNSAVAENLDGWPMEFNAMEIVNSSATQTDMLQLTNDWMSLLNRGAAISPIGSSDSHDVARHFVGQARTYIRCDDGDPGNIDIAAAVAGLQRGNVMVSYGLLATLNVNGQSSGNLIPLEGDSVKVDIQVLGPSWITADRVELYANGQLIRSEEISSETVPQQTTTGNKRGIKWESHWMLARPHHDVHLVAIAVGPGIDLPYWKTARPYQPMSPSWNPHVMGCSGAVWLDADRDGQRTSARDYARRIWDSSAGDQSQLFRVLADYDAAVAAHVADFYQESGRSLTDTLTNSSFQTAAPSVKLGFRNYFEAWRATEAARVISNE